MRNVIAVVTTYNVDSAFSSRLHALLPQVPKIVIIDNSEEEASRAYLREIAADHNGQVVLIQNEMNEGLAAAQNKGIAYALHHEAEWVLLMDDDSTAALNMVDILLAAWDAHPAKETIAIVAPVPVDRHTNIRQPAIFRRGFWWFRRGQVSETEVRDDIGMAIASGSLIRADVLRELGGMREDYFIDYIDTEFSLRAIFAGYRVMMVGSACLYHSIGAKTEHSLFGRTFVTTNHTPIRRYTIYRNRVCMWRGYAGKVPGYIFYDMMASVYHMLRMLAFEQQKFTKLAAILKGVWHGLWMPREVMVKPFNQRRSDLPLASTDVATPEH